MEKIFYLSTPISDKYLDTYHKIIGDQSFNYMMKHYDSKIHKIKIAGKQKTILANPIEIRVQFITPHKITINSYQNNTTYEYTDGKWELLKD